MSYAIKSPRKLIEVALPLDKINEACVREKSIRHGHPSALHLWWARRPLAAARAVLFAQLVNDPGYQQGSGFKYGKNKKEAAEERKRLFRIMEELVLWENTTNERVLDEARAEIRRSWREVCELNKEHPEAAELFNPDRLPGFHDPFAGGGAIPLEAQRLGLESFASDLNPVAVLINKAMIEIPPKFVGSSPVGPLPRGEQSSNLGLNREWAGTTGLSEDLRRYGIWMREEAQRQIGHFYPPVEITMEMAKERPDLQELVGQKLTVIAWLWTRTVKSPNPAFSHVDVPLSSTFILSSKSGREAYIVPIINKDSYRFTVKLGPSPDEYKNGTKLARASFGCIFSGTPIEIKYIRKEACEGHMGARLMAVIAEGEKGRVYLPPTVEMEEIALSAKPKWKPELKVTTPCHDVDRLPMYGMFTWGDAFTSRQLVALTTFSDLIEEVKNKIYLDSIKSGMLNDNDGIEQNGTGAKAYSELLSIYLTFLIGQLANHSSSICGWNHPNTQMRSVFSKQAIQMTWDYAEVNIFSSSSGSYLNLHERSIKALSALVPNGIGHATQANAQEQKISDKKIISTDPPYYDNIGYADLSDFFYVWLRPSMRKIFPQLFSTISVPKEDELVATPYRHGSKSKAEQFFLNGMTKAISHLAVLSHPGVPVTIYYAFKQSESEGNSGTASTGWETFLEAVLRAGFALTGTWPVRTEKEGRSVGNGTNALASSIVLVCRPRSEDAPTVSRREFQRELNQVLPEALDEMTKGTTGGRSPVAPVDLSQAIIGPGMGVFSKYKAVLEADGSPMTVRSAMQLINRFLAEDDFDADTQFCMHWFEQFGWKVGEFGQADVLARSKATAVDGLAQAGVIEAGGGSVRLLKWAEYPTDWDPLTDTRLPVWEALHQMIRTFKQGGDSAAGAVASAIPGKMEAVRQLAYRLYTLCERQGWAEDARAYNELITSWSGIETASSSIQPTQRGLFD